ncbi:hypothetical protein BpHYR1_000073 [Brachionus plicatilis]|uniref:Uncharacterized protein n=1 Tax=Brachionus plicatilis TaxID=10195 RepID=A0A3M7SEJ9_BRAPC|nr:hypothetical protein BpHYR1_000073 [Brachionus plicatilis]
MRNFLDSQISERKIIILYFIKIFLIQKKINALLIVAQVFQSIGKIYLKSFSSFLNSIKLPVTKIREKIISCVKAINLQINHFNFISFQLTSKRYQLFYNSLKKLNMPIVVEIIFVFIEN